MLNRTVASGGAATPYELWVGKRPNLGHLRVFGSQAYVHVPKQFTRKFDARAQPRVFVGYQDDLANYRVYDPESKKINVSRNVTSNEVIGKSGTILEHDEEEMTVLPRSQAPEERNEQQQEVQEISDESDDEFTEVEEFPIANNRAQPRPQDEQGRRALRDRTSIRRPR